MADVPVPVRASAGRKRMRGDVSDSFERMRRLLARMRYRRPVDATRACAGDVQELLPLLHYALMAYSPDVTRLISSSGHDLLGKTDARFVEASWRALGDLLGYRPSLSAKQFMARGFAERKLATLSDVFQLVMEKKQRLAPVSKSPRGQSVVDRSPKAPAVVREVTADSSHEHVAVQPQREAEPLPQKRPEIPDANVVALTMRVEAQTRALTQLTERFAELESTMQNKLAAIDAKLVIMDGRIRFVEHNFSTLTPPQESQPTQPQQQQQQDRHEVKDIYISQPPAEEVDEGDDEVGDTQEYAAANLSTGFYTSHEGANPALQSTRELVDELDDLPESQACLKGIMERMRQTQEILDRSRDSAAPTTLSSNPDRQDS